MADVGRGIIFANLVASTLQPSSVRLCGELEGLTRHFRCWRACAPTISSADRDHGNDPTSSADHSPGVRAARRRAASALEPTSACGRPSRTWARRARSSLRHGVGTSFLGDIW
jgi:hypothetical protein